MNLNFSNYPNHGTGYVIKVVYPKKGKLNTETLVIGNAQVLPKIKEMSENNIFDIASLTKLFTSIIIHKTIEKGLLNIDDKIKDIDENFVNLENISVKDLMAHKQEIWTDGYLGSAGNKEEFYKILYSARVKTNVRTYVDVHYIILSTLLERIYQLPFAKLVDNEIIKVLKLENTAFSCLNEDLAVSNNYELVNGKVVDYVYPGVVHDSKARRAKELGINVGHAGIFTDANDFIKLLISFIDNNYLLLSKESIERMLNHDDIYNDMLECLKSIAKEADVILNNYSNLDEMYTDIAKTTINENELLSKIIRPYNYGGTRYKNPIHKKNEIPPNASDNSIIFSGYTGPIFFIDFSKQIIILIMTNVCHNSNLDRNQRYNLSKNMVNDLYNYILTKL